MENDNLIGDEENDCAFTAIPDSDIAVCAAVLKQIQPSELSSARYASVLEAGVPLFRRHILKERLGDGDAVDFLKEKCKIKKMTDKMEKLHKVVADVHEGRRQKAQTCGMNTKRKADLAKIIAESAVPEDTAPAICNVETSATTTLLTEGQKNVNSMLSAKSGIDVAQCREARRFDDTCGAVASDVDSASHIPVDSLYSACNMCRGEYNEQHHFYHQLCPRCAEHNWEKRSQTADMSGMVCVVTGGRVRIGFAIVLKLLRAGAFVLTTTRYPNDCLQRYAQESDFDSWSDRLEVCGPVEFCDLKLVERFCDQLVRRFPRIHVLINNAAQTLSRPAGWHERMMELECRAAKALPDQAKARLSTHLSEGPEFGRQPSAQLPVLTDESNKEDPKWGEALTQLQDFPKGIVDESRQPLDLSGSNSWSRRVGEVSTVELLQTLAANTAAPFVLVSRLAPVLAAPTEADSFGHIVNVSALEGKFSVRNKSPGHPHTNMAKAALNMLTHTSARDMFQRRVLMNCVDTGWVTDMAPGGVGVVAAEKATWVAPPLDEEDGAARVLDPVFSHINDPAWLVRGRFFKNYYVCQW